MDNTLNNTDGRDGVETSRENLPTTQVQNAFDDGSDDSQNLDEDIAETTDQNPTNTFSETNQIEDEPASELFSIDAAPPSFGAQITHAASLPFHEPTDLKWDPSSQSEEYVSSPKKDGSDDSTNEFMAPPARSTPKVHRSGKESYGNIVSEMSFFEKFGDHSYDDDAEFTTNESPKHDGIDDIAPVNSLDDIAPTQPRVHQKGKESYGNVVSEMSFFEKFGSQSEDPNEAVGEPTGMLAMKSDESSDAFMSPPGTSKPKVHRKGKESYGNVISETSFFEKFSEKSDEPPPVRNIVQESQDGTSARSVRGVPAMRSPEPVPDSKISKLVSLGEVDNIPSHRQKQASVGFAISDLSFSQKFGIADNDDPPPVLTVTEGEPKELDLGEEASTSESLRQENETEEMESLRQENQRLRDVLEEAFRKIDEQKEALSSKESELQASRESKIRLLQASSAEITRLKDVIGLLAKHQTNQG